MAVFPTAISRLNGIPIVTVNVTVKLAPFPGYELRGCFISSEEIGKVKENVWFLFVVVLFSSSFN